MSGQSSLPRDKKLVYLHGFNSSPDSWKARALSGFMRERGIEHLLEVPAIPPVPLEAVEMLMTMVEQLNHSHTVALAGSSLGGFYATCLAERYGCSAVLINPAVRPQELLEQYLGENVNYYTSEVWQLEETHIEQFRQMDVEHITRPERYLLMLQTGDETLDYRQAQQKYQNCPSIIEQNGNHSFSGFENHIPRVLAFSGIHVS